MFTFESRGVCPKCKYEGAWCQVDSCGAEHGACPRCGWGYDGRRDAKGNWVEEEYTGLGVVGYRVKGTISFIWGSYDDAMQLEEWRADLRKADCDVAVYTYQQDGPWYIHNLLSGERLLATEESLAAAYEPDAEVAGKPTEDGQ